MSPDHDPVGRTPLLLSALAARHRLIAACPEVAGGLPTPRPAAEIQPDGSVRTEAGVDVTEPYRRGADHAVAVAAAAGVAGAVLEARSPSCGCGQVDDGTWSRRLRPGHGVTAAARKAAGVTVHTEEEVAGGWPDDRVEPGGGAGA